MHTDSVTQLTAAARGRAVLCASHGGVYAAWYAARLGVSAVVLHDAGVGREQAGIGGLAWLEARGVPAAAVGHRSARIGDAADMLARGMVSFVNAAAGRCGVVAGMTAAAALAALERAALPAAVAVEAMGEARREVAPGVFVLDSNGLVRADDAGRVVVTGSHGGLLAGRPESAVKAAVAAAVYNDAGVGVDGAGVSRLAALEARGIAGAAVSCWSARIGDGGSTWEDGVVSFVNGVAAARGARVGMATREFVAACFA